MKLSKLRKEIKGIFKPPVKRYYFGKIQHGTHYFYPMNFTSSIIYLRKLKLKSIEQLKKYEEKYPHLIGKVEYRFSNLPMVRRNKYWIVKLFKHWYYIELGIPLVWGKVELGWKDKFETPRFEWSPMLYIYFFKWQFCIWWNSPDEDNYKYYEMILWWLEYSNKDIKLAEETWGWTDYDTKESTWNKNYLL